MLCHVPVVIMYSSVMSNIFETGSLGYAVQEGMYNLYFGGIFDAASACKRSPRLDIMGGHLLEVRL